MVETIASPIPGGHLHDGFRDFSSLDGRPAVCISTCCVLGISGVSKRRVLGLRFVEGLEFFQYQDRNAREALESTNDIDMHDWIGVFQK